MNGSSLLIKYNCFQILQEFPEINFIIAYLSWQKKAKNYINYLVLHDCIWDRKIISRKYLPHY